MKAIAIDMLCVIAILAGIVAIPALVIIVIAIAVGLIKYAVEKMNEKADELSDYLYARKEAKDFSDRVRKVMDDVRENGMYEVVEEEEDAKTD